MSIVEGKKLPIIEHTFSFNRNGSYVGYPYSNSFTSKELPDVVFKILCDITDNNKMVVVVSKTPSTLASACVSILYNKELCRQVEISDWEEHFVFDVSNFNYCIYHPPFTCSISWNGFVDKIIPPQSNRLYDHTKYLLDTPDLADIVITVNNEKIHAHKIILAVQSPVFLAMFQTNMTESANNQIDIKDIDIDIMRKVIEFLYTGELDVTFGVDVLLPILAASDKYQITDLKNLCENILDTKITIDTALKILDEASLYGVPQLIKNTITFMVDNKLEIAQLDDFKSFYSKKPELLYEFIIRCIGK